MKFNKRIFTFSIIVLLSLFVAVLVTTPFASATTANGSFGYTTQGGSNDWINANNLEGSVYQYTGPTGGNLTSVSFYIGQAHASGIHIEMLVYSWTSNTGAISLIATSTIYTSNSVGWNVFAFPSGLSLTHNTNYWLISFTDTTDSTSGYFYTSGSTYQGMYIGSSYGSGAPASLGSGGYNTRNRAISMYANYTYQTASVTFTSSTTGSGFITVNGTAQTTPYTIAAANVSDVYTIAANSPANLVSGQSQYIYSSWSDSGAQSHSYTVTAGGGTVTATFQQQFYLTVTNGNSPTGQGWVNAGSTTTASNAWIWGTSGNTRYALTNYQLDGANQNPSRSNTGTFTTPSITMSTYHTANFVSVTQYFLTVQNGNSVSYGTPSQTADNWYDSGTSTTVSSAWVWGTVTNQTRNDLVNYQLDYISQNPARAGSGILTTSSVTMSAHHTVTFVAGTQCYLAVLGGNGVTFSSPSETGDNWYDPTDSAITVSSNWVWSTVAGQSQTGIINYAIDGSNKNPTQQFTGTLTTSTMSFFSTYHSVVFASTPQYYLTISSSHGTPSGQGWYNSGAVATASVNAGTIAGSTGTQYVFSSWSLGGSTYSASNAITMSSYYTDMASWQTQYSITSSSDSNSAITPSSTVWVNLGSNQTFTYTPNSGYLMQSCLVDSSNVPVTGNYTFSSVSTFHTISVSSNIFLSNMTVVINQWPTTNNILNFTATSNTLTNGTVIFDLLGNNSLTYPLNNPYNIASDWNNNTGILTLRSVQNNSNVVIAFNRYWGDFYVTQIDSNIASLGWTGQALTINTQGSNGTFSIYTGSRNAPQAIDGLTSTSYNQTTNILSGSYGANAQIILDWAAAPGSQPTATPTPTPYSSPSPLPNSPITLDSKVDFGKVAQGQNVTKTLNVNIGLGSIQVTAITFTGAFSSAWLTTTQVLPHTFNIGANTVKYNLAIPLNATAKTYTGTVAIRGIDAVGNEVSTSVPFSFAVIAQGQNTAVISSLLIYIIIALIVIVILAVVIAKKLRRF